MQTRLGRKAAVEAAVAAAAAAAVAVAEAAVAAAAAEALGRRSVCNASRLARTRLDSSGGRSRIRLGLANPNPSLNPYR